MFVSLPGLVVLAGRVACAFPRFPGLTLSPGLLALLEVEPGLLTVPLEVLVVVPLEETTPRDGRVLLLAMLSVPKREGRVRIVFRAIPP